MMTTTTTRHIRFLGFAYTGLHIGLCCRKSKLGEHHILPVVVSRDSGHC